LCGWVVIVYSPSIRIIGEKISIVGKNYPRPFILWGMLRGLHRDASPAEGMWDPMVGKP